MNIYVMNIYNVYLKCKFSAKKKKKKNDRSNFFLFAVTLFNKFFCEIVYFFFFNAMNIKENSGIKHEIGGILIKSIYIYELYKYVKRYKMKREKWRRIVINCPTVNSIKSIFTLNAVFRRG